MSALLLRVFSELGGSAAVSSEPMCVNTAGCGPQGSPVLLLGPTGSQKSGLLFVAAVLAAEEGAGPVIFLSREPVQEMPRGGRAAREPLILKKIRFMYPSSLKDLLHFFSSLHVTSPSPSLVLVDGLERYLPSAGSLTDGAHISALMLDSISHLHCGLLVSAVPGSEGSDAFTAVERYFPNQCRLCPVMSTETEERQYKVSFLSPDPQWTLHVEQYGGLRISLEDRSPKTKT
ncbi:PREDICTED: ATPase SWSAP1 [Nanorana parkeri]|uniref:ATPase SWSAP1 n=1 Tax=Nanorana parkeri TaxID=125878 RepID=UPI000854663B|nr:PREDICTED: ATPase SWSAP1 [Nanorana parkeri]